MKLTLTKEKDVVNKPIVRANGLEYGIYWGRLWDLEEGLYAVTYAGGGSANKLVVDLDEPGRTWNNNAEFYGMPERVDLDVTAMVEEK